MDTKEQLINPNKKCPRCGSTKVHIINNIKGKPPGQINSFHCDACGNDFGPIPREQS